MYPILIKINIMTKFFKSYFSASFLILMIISLFLSLSSIAQSKEDYDNIDRNYEILKKRLDKNEAKESDGLLSYYLQLKIQKFKEDNKGYYVVNTFFSKSIPQLIYEAKTKAVVMYLLNQENTIVGLIDVYEKRINETSRNFFIKENYNYSWMLEPNYESIIIKAYELLPNGMVLCAFDLSKIEFNKGEMSFEFEIITSEQNTKINRSIYYSIKTSQNIQISKESSYEYLNDIMIEKYPVISKLGFEKLNKVKVVSDSYKKNDNSLGVKLVRHEGVFVIK